MEHILLYADSLSWGIVPNTRDRLPFDKRWPGVMENRLNAREQRVRVIEDCLNGRRTVWDDPFKAGRNGLLGISERIEVHSPLSLVILLLGTNDFQSMHPHNAWHSAQGIAALIRAIRHAPIEPGMPVPPILVSVPPSIQAPKGPIAPKFLGGDAKCVGLADAYREVADAYGCHFFDCNSVTSSSRIDGVHLDGDQHLTLGEKMAEVVSSLLWSSGQHSP
jgi:lysophospholipase L1-like esterase